jgi:hypothetical protein
VDGGGGAAIEDGDGVASAPDASQVSIAVAKNELANILSDTGDHAEAFALYEEVLALFTARCSFSNRFFENTIP